MSAACSHVIAPLNARMRTCWIFMARSTAAAANTMVTSFVDHGCTPDCPKSGHFTCSRERTDHVLPTVDRDRLTASGREHSVGGALAAPASQGGEAEVGVSDLRGSAIVVMEGGISP